MIQRGEFMPMISPEVNDKLNDLVAYQFYLNRVWDAGLSKLNVDFVMNNFEKTFHNGLAHKFPLLADAISEVQANFNSVTTYKLTPEGRNDFATPLEFLEFALTEMIRGQKMIIDITKTICDTEDDFGVNSIIGSALKKFSIAFAVYVGQVALLRDKSKAYGQKPLNLQLFDEEADSFLIPLKVPTLLD